MPYKSNMKVTRDQYDAIKEHLVRCLHVVGYKNIEDAIRSEKEHFMEQRGKELSDYGCISRMFYYPSQFAVELTRGLYENPDFNDDHLKTACLNVASDLIEEQRREPDVYFDADKAEQLIASLKEEREKMFDTALYIMGQSGQSLDEQISRLLIEVESPEERYGHFMMQRSRDDAVMDPDELRYGQENYLNFILADDTVPPARKDMFKEDMTVSRTPMEVLERGLSRIQGWNKNLEPVRQDYERRATQTNTI